MAAPLSPAGAVGGAAISAARARRRRRGRSRTVPTVGALLKSVEAWWVAEDFAPDEAALRRRLQQMLAAAQ